MAIILETEHLLLRHQEITDLDALWALYCKPEITRYIPDAPKTFEEARLELEWFLHGHPKYPELGLWATIYKDSGVFIGRCGLLPWLIEDKLEVEVAYTLAQDYWGRGLATEAAQAIMNYGFKKLLLPRLICLIDPENVASQRVAEKIGMSLEKKLDGIDGDNYPTWIYMAENQTII
jgi:RimJ/RimL family protein N-acetyltransferase